MVTIDLLVILLLAFVARFLIPQMMHSEKAGVRFGIGFGLFGMYTVACIAAFRYVCTEMNNGAEIADLSCSTVWGSILCAFLLINVTVLFTACVFFFCKGEKKVKSRRKNEAEGLVKKDGESRPFLFSNIGICGILGKK